MGKNVAKCVDKVELFGGCQSLNPKETSVSRVNIKCRQYKYTTVSMEETDTEEETGT